MNTTFSQESRTHKTFLNARVNFIFYFLTLALTFFSRKIFLDCLGTDFFGLTGTLGNILGYLNLVELGVGSAIGYLLYKPLYDHDKEKINEIISVMGFLYRRIGYIILAGGVIISFFLPLIFPNRDSHLSLLLIYFSYYSFLASTLIGYFINYRQNLLGADQRNYVVTVYFQSANLIKLGLQMWIAYKTKNAFFWVAIELIFGFLYSFILNWKINQTYPWLKTNVKKGRELYRKYPEVMKKTKQLFVHKIAGNVTLQSYNLLIYAFSSLSMVALFANYTIIVDRITALFTTLLGSVSASLGNLVAENNKQKTIKMFWAIASLNIYACGIVFYGVLTYSNAFIKIWLGEEYVISFWILSPYYFKKICDFTTSNLGSFLYAHGLFYDTWAPIVESIICLIISIIGGYYWGLFGVLLGSMTSNVIINLIWKSYFLFQKGLKTRYIDFWLFFIKMSLIQIGCFFFCNYLINYIQIEITGYITLLYSAIISVSLFSVITFVLFYIISSGYRSLINQLINYFFKVKYSCIKY